MADTKISALTAASALGGTEKIPGVQSGGNVAITPNQIVALVAAASETTQGKVELATNAESVTGTDTARAVTPAGLKAHTDAIAIPDATTTVKGKVELATTAEATAGTDTARAVTPAGLKAHVDDAVGAISVPNIYTTRATVANLAADSMGSYFVDLGGAGFADTNYTVSISIEDFSTTGANEGLEVVRFESKTSTSITVIVRNRDTVLTDMSGSIHVIAIHD